MLRGWRPLSGPHALWLDALDDFDEVYDSEVGETDEAAQRRRKRVVLKDVAEELAVALEARLNALREPTEELLEAEIRRQMMVAAASADYQTVATLHETLLTLQSLEL